MPTSPLAPLRKNYNRLKFCGRPTRSSTLLADDSGFWQPQSGADLTGASYTICLRNPIGSDERDSHWEASAGTNKRVKTKQPRQIESRERVRVSAGNVLMAGRTAYKWAMGAGTPGELPSREGFGSMNAKSVSAGVTKGLEQRRRRHGEGREIWRFSVPNMSVPIMKPFVIPFHELWETPLTFRVRVIRFETLRRWISRKRSEAMFYVIY